jgi:hypothetical protein
MEALIEPRSFLGIIEHDLPELSAVDGFIGKHDFRTEVFDHLFPCLLARFQEFMDNLVGIDDVSSKVLENLCNETFAACDPAGESYDKHVLSSSPVYP